MHNKLIIKKSSQGECFKFGNITFLPPDKIIILNFVMRQSLIICNIRRKIILLFITKYIFSNQVK